ncbi:MAG TPA: DHA2 family efflux MFS transporter permease subunit [Candidatus Binataceae bacterium]|nr:DHA2 family efflux MFS transporter permease subunit [Candidatus Binataceae bacterium]
MAAAAPRLEPILKQEPRKERPLPSLPKAGQAGAPHKWLVAIAVMLGATLEILDSSIVNVCLPHMQGSFSASVDEVTWVITSYIVANGIMIPLTGWISSRFGRKRYFLISVGIFVAASAACGAAQSMTQMVIFRLVQGAAGAAMIPSSQAILMETFPPGEQALAMAMYGVGIVAAPVLGPTLGGWITDNWSWRWNFYINIPLGIVAAVMVYVFVHDPDFMREARKKHRRVDYMGIAYLALGLGLLQIVLDRGQRADWFAATWVCVFTVAAVAMLVALVFHELRFPDPILDLTILKIPLFVLAVSMITFMYLILYGANLLNPLFFQELLGYPAWRAGLAVVPRSFGTLIAMLLIAQLARRAIDTRWLVGVGFAGLACALWTMGHWTLDVGMDNIRFAIFLSGFAGGLIFPTMSAATLACVERERMGYAASLYAMMRNTGSAIGISLVSNLLNSRQQMHQSYLGEHVTIFDAWKLDQAAPRMPGAPNLHLLQGLSLHQPQGLGMIYAELQRQAALMTYNDIYRMLAIMAALLIPTFLLLKRNTGKPAVAH